MDYKIKLEILKELRETLIVQSNPNSLAREDRYRDSSDETKQAISVVVKSLAEEVVASKG